MKNLAINKVLLLGSGALKIGQAGEFDYSGAQALKALREDGVETVLINPNIATVQTSEGIADRIYFLPVTPFFVEKVIAKERPQGILLSFGGQTALNCGVELYRSGVLEKYDVQVLGTPVTTIMDTEDRELFVERLDEIGVLTIKSHPASNLEEARAAARDLGYPLILRSAYALGGLGSGFVDNDAELEELCTKSFSFTPQVLVEKSLKGWKEIEFEVVRDAADRCITVCNMENFDPLGIHTGESIVLAPCQSLSQKDVDYLTELAVKIVRHLGIVGECNIQFAYDETTMDYRVIEVNARLSRSSALASKATGYPLAFVATKIGLGYELPEIRNTPNGIKSAYYEPDVQYVVCKIPRWDLGKFHGVSRKIGTSMKSVGEVMAIGLTFEETIQKGLRMIGQGSNGFVGNKPYEAEDLADALANPTDTRMFDIAKAMSQGWSIERINDLTKIDKWFLERLENIVRTWDTLGGYDSLDSLPEDLLRQAKQQGFSDRQIALALYKDKASQASEDEVRAKRIGLGIVPVVKRIDTLAAATPEQSNYLYFTYNSSENEVAYEEDGRSVVVLGSGEYHIGSSVEFDWCSVSCMQEIRRQGWRGIMVNYNPETVSTDYDMCDRLYFDELSLERVMDIIGLETPKGVVVSVGGQIPNNLAVKLAERGVNILGTAAKDIDRAEDRHKFSSIVDALGIDQPRWSELTTLDDVDRFIGEVGFPVLVRPSYVLSGSAMSVCYDRSTLIKVLSRAVEVSAEHPVIISKFMSRSKEIEFDAVADGGRILVSAIGEHIEYAGVHSGDATIEFPAQKLYVETVRKVKEIAAKIAAELHISGPFNIQFLANDNNVRVIECNLRASRSFPFVSKVLKTNFIEMATKVMLGQHPEPVDTESRRLGYVGVKSAQFSFSRLQEADPLLGVDMASTGEVGCLGDDVYEALLKSVIAVGYEIPKKRILISSGNALQKADLLSACDMLARNGYEILATGGSCDYLHANDIPAKRVLFPDESENPVMLSLCPSATDLIRSHEVDMVINIPKNFTDAELDNGYRIRRAAIDANVPLFTNARLSTAFIKAFCTLTPDDLSIKAWDEYN